MKASEWAKCDEPQSVETWRRRQKAILADFEAKEAELKLEVEHYRECAQQLAVAIACRTEVHGAMVFWHGELQRAKDALARMNEAFSICDKAREKAEAKQCEECGELGDRAEKAEADRADLLAALKKVYELGTTGEAFFFPDVVDLIKRCEG